MLMSGHALVGPRGPRFDSIGIRAGKRTADRGFLRCGGGAAPAVMVAVVAVMIVIIKADAV